MLNFKLNIFDFRRKIHHEASLVTGARSSKQHADLQEKRNTLFRRITQWREVQLAYMPAVAALLLKSGPILLNPDEDTVNTELAETIPLHLPSSLPPSLQNSPALLSLAEKELRLRLGQADEALENIRQNRRTLSGLIRFKKFNISGAGNKPNTRFRTVVNRLQNRIQQAADTYRAAYNTLSLLQPEGEWKKRFQVLHAEDIRGPERQPDDPTGQSRGRYEASWIWLVGRGSRVIEPGEEELDETMRAEWAKMKARQDRWNEEYQLIQEEMRRTVAYLEWKARWWRAQTTRRAVDDPVLAQGLVAYAERQADLLERLAYSCIKKWIPLLKKNGADVLWAGQYQIWEEKLESDSEDEDEENGEEKGKEKARNEGDMFDSYELND